MGSIARSGTWDEASSPAATRLARRFEDAWRDPRRRRGHRPDPSDFLPEGPGGDAPPAAWLALLRADLNLRWDDGGPVRVEEYRDRFPRPRRRDDGRPLLRGVLPSGRGRPGPLPGRVRRAVPRPLRPAQARLRHPRTRRQRRLDRPPRPRPRADPLPRGPADHRRFPPRRGAGPGVVRPGLPRARAATGRPAGRLEGGEDRLSGAPDARQAPAHLHRPGPLVSDRPRDGPAPALHALFRPGDPGSAPGGALGEGDADGRGIAGGAGSAGAFGIGGDAGGRIVGDW